MKWNEMPPEERAKRWAFVQPETHGEWLASVARRMEREGCGHGSAMEQTRKAEKEASRVQVS